MKKIYTSFGKKLATCLLFFSGLAGTAFSQPICGNIVQDFSTASGAATFTGSYSYNSTTQKLQRSNVIATEVYTITTPSYKLIPGYSYVGVGFTMDGSEQIARAEIDIIYTSTLTNQPVIVQFGQYIPDYGGGAVASLCVAKSISDLPGFPSNGTYRFQIRLASNSGAGSATNTTTFDDFRTTGTASITPTPVVFTGIEAKKVNANVVLTWRVAGEENVSHYEVERSLDGHNFENIADVYKTGRDVYSITDNNNSATLYYRVKNVDVDSKFKYSTIVRLANGRSELVLKAFPQPVRNQLTLQHPSITGKALLSISTADGKAVRMERPSPGSIQTSVDMSSLQPGMYLLRFDDGSGNIQTLKVVKQ